jgi:anti-sigma B factor antagonist
MLCHSAPKEEVLMRLSGQPIGEEVDVVEVHGDLDLVSCAALKQRLRNAIDEGWSRVLVDLTDVAFVDSSGLAALVFAQRRLDSLGGAIAVVAPAYQQRRCFELTGLTTILGVRATKPEAVAHLATFG